MATNDKEEVRKRLLQRQATKAANANNTAIVNAVNANAAAAMAATRTMNVENGANDNAANANAANVNAMNANAANANATPTTTTKTKRGKLPKAPARNADAFDELMNAVVNQEGGNGDTVVKKITTIRGLLDVVTLDENRKCDDFERYLHR